MPIQRICLRLATAFGATSRHRDAMPPVRSGGGRARFFFVAVAVVAALALWGLPAGAFGPPITTTFTSTGAEQTYTVPAGVTSVHVEAVGGKGAFGAFGAVTTADIAVDPGSVLFVEVGGNGANRAPGFNGGGDSPNAGDGGGASDVRTCSISITTCVVTGNPMTDPRRIVAGGGGGGGGGQGHAGGSGGDPEGHGGGNSPTSSPGSPGNGGGGTTVAGGTGGLGDRTFNRTFFEECQAGQPGVAGAGGAGGGAGGGSSEQPCLAGGGGGGGGWYGGGGGGAAAGMIVAAGGGGGGGSSFAEVNASGVSYAVDATGVPLVRITAGADLTVSLDDTPDPVTLGATYDYTLTVANGGPDSATGTSATLTLSGASRTIMSTTPSQGSCTFDASVSCELGSIVADGTATVTVTVQPTAAGTITATATASAIQPDDPATPSSASQTTRVAPVPATATGPGRGPAAGDPTSGREPPPGRPGVVGSPRGDERPTVTTGETIPPSSTRAGGLPDTGGGYGVAAALMLAGALAWAWTRRHALEPADAA